VSGEVEMGDLEKMPHLLIAGTTGSGKSVCINTILTALLFQNTPEQLQLILVDPKRVELSLYNGIPHLKSEVIVENKKVLGALRWAVGEMERRYRILQDNQSRNIEAYNDRVIQKRKKGSFVLAYMPYIVIVIDELADLMGTHGKEVEGAIARLAQMSRAVGIHLIIATQRPDVHVLTGLIKTNISTRIAFKVPTQIDSRTILDKGGAEKLLGLGDMLYIHNTNPTPTRIQGVFLSVKEVKNIVRFWKKQDDENRSDGDIEKSDVEVNAPVLEMGDMAEKVGSFHEKLDMDTLGQEDSARDSMFDEAKELVENAGKASTSLIQRHLRIGYNRAARIIDELEAEGIVGPADGAKPREVFTAKNDNQ
jgi:S-DNA-T family DNA segregation ATPase FtsK/SpoIIIE